MRNFAYLTLILFILTFVVVPPVHAQSDGGDGVSGAGADNTSYDSGPTDSGNNGDGEGDQQVDQGNGGEGAGPTGDGSTFDNQSQETQDAFSDAAGGNMEAAEANWNSEHVSEVATGYTADGREIGPDGTPGSGDETGASQSESRGESVTREDVQAAQGEVNSAAAAQHSAYDRAEFAQKNIDEINAGIANGTIDPSLGAGYLSQFESAHSAAMADYHAASYNLSIATDNAASTAAAAEQQHAGAAAASAEQQGKQDAASDAGKSAIAGGNTDLDSVISGSGLAGANLSPDRNAAVIGGWANQLGIDPGQAAAYAAHFAAGQAGATVSSVAGSASIAAQTAGGSAEQMAASAAAAAAMQVGGTNPEAQTNASREAGLATYTTAVNSNSSLGADEKGAMVTAFGAANGSNAAQVAAAVSTTGANKEASLAGIAAAFQSNGSTATTQQLTAQAGGGWGTAPAAGAAAAGIVPGGPALTTPGGVPAPASGSAPSGAGNAAVSAAIADPGNRDGEGKVTQSGLHNIVNAAIGANMDAKQLAETLRDAERTGAVAGGITGTGIRDAANAYSGPAQFQGAGGTAQSYGAQAAGYFGNPNTYQGTNVTVTNPAAPAAAPAAAAPAAAPAPAAPAPAAPAPANQTAAFAVPPGTLTQDTNKTVPVTVAQEAGAVSISGGGAWGSQAGGGVSWSMSGYQGSGSASAGGQKPEEGQLQVTTTAANGASTTKDFDITGASFIDLQNNFASITTTEQLNNAIQSTNGVKAK